MTETINNETKICDIKFKYLVADEYISSENRDEYFGAKMTDFLANKQFAEMGIFGTEIEKLKKWITKNEGDAEENQRLKDKEDWDSKNPVGETKEEFLEAILKLVGNDKNKKLVKIGELVKNIQNWEPPKINPFNKKTAGGGAPRGKMAKNSDKQQVKYGREEGEKCKAIIKKKGTWTRCIWKTGKFEFCSRHCKIEKDGGEITTITDREDWVEDERLKL